MLGTVNGNTVHFITISDWNGYLCYTNGMATRYIKIGNFDAAYCWKLFTYDPTAGELRHQFEQEGGLAGSYYNEYLVLNIDGRTFLGHRIIWLMMTGEWPIRMIDHMNRKRWDNKWNNLRLASASQQGRNVLYQNNKSGTNGVMQNGQRWIVWRQMETIRITYGSYTTKEEAVRVKEEIDFIDLRRGWTWHGLWVWDV